MKRSLGCLAAALLVSRTASADHPAEKLFQEGKALVKAGKLAEACDAFERSDDLEPRVGTVLNLADCRARQGRIAAAWALFQEARYRAIFTYEPRAEFAAARVSELEKQLAFLTLEVAPQQAVDGLVVKRSGAVVPATAWNQPVAVEPADYTIEASAPNLPAWSVTRVLKPGDRITVTIVPAAPAEASVAAAPIALATTRPAPAEVDVVRDVVETPPPTKRRYFAVGAALGVAAGKVSSAPNSNEDVLQDDHMPIGLRLLGNLPVPHGAVRAIASALYTKGLNDKTDPSNWKKLYVIGLAADFILAPRSTPNVAFAAGVGIGWDYEVRSFDQGTDLAQTTSLRASPIIYRLAKGAVEVGVHTQLVVRGDGVGFIGLAAVDVFLL